MKFLKILKNPKFYLNYILESFKPYQININKKKFWVKYRPFWKSVNEGKWEIETFEIFDRFTSSDYSYVDIGAWLGPTVLYGCQTARHCYAIEPDPISFKHLSDNIKLNPNFKSKISLFNHCISDKNKKVKFGNKTSFGNSMSSILFGNQESSILIDSFTLERFFEINKINDCNFIKIDIEGSETLLFSNSKGFFEKYKPTIHLSLHPQLFKNCEKECQIILNSLNIYKNIFDNKGNKLDSKILLSELVSKKVGMDIVATDEDWK